MSYTRTRNVSPIFCCQYIKYFSGVFRYFSERAEALRLRVVKLFINSDTKAI